MRMGEHCRTKRVVFSRLEGKTARFIGQILLHAHAGMDILAISGFGEVRKKSIYMQPKVAYIAGRVCKQRDQQSTEVTSSF